MVHVIILSTYEKYFKLKQLVGLRGGHKGAITYPLTKGENNNQEGTQIA